MVAPMNGGTTASKVQDAKRGGIANLTNAGKGRKKGVPNKTTKLAKQAIADAFDNLGGTDALVEWAQKNDENRKVFYSQIWTKIIPLQVSGDPDSPIQTESKISLTDAPIEVLQYLASQVAK